MATDARVICVRLDSYCGAGLYFTAPETPSRKNPRYHYYYYYYYYYYY